jgi:pilus assembly protein CpaB
MRFGGLFIGIFIAALAAVFVLRGGEEAASPAPAPQVAARSEAVRTVNIYVAREAIPIGTVVSDAMFTVQPWPEHLLVSGFVRADGSTTLAGMVSRGYFQPQEPIIKSKLANANDPSFIAGTLPDGLRVITLETNEIRGLSGVLSAGDRVDVLLTREVVDRVFLDPQDTRKAHEFSITETILTDARVIAVNQHTSPTNDVESAQQKRYQPPRTVSLAVTPRDAQRLRLAEKVGDVSLTLRGIANAAPADDLGITFVNDVSSYSPAKVGFDTDLQSVSAKSATRRGQTVRVIRGAALSD